MLKILSVLCKHCLGGKGQKTFQVFEFEYTYLEKVTCQGALRPRERLQIDLVFG